MNFFFLYGFAFAAKSTNLYKLKPFNQLKLKILKSIKGKAIYFSTNKDMRGFLVRYIFQKVLLSNK